MKTKTGLLEVNRCGVLNGVLFVGMLAFSACSDEPASNPYENLGGGGAGGLAPTTSQTIPSPTPSQPTPSNTGPEPSNTVPAPSQTLPTPGGTGGAPPVPTVPVPTSPAPSAGGAGGMNAGGMGGMPQQLEDAGAGIVLPSDAGLPGDDAGDAGVVDASTDTEADEIDAGASETETAPDAASTEPSDTDTDTDPPVEPLWDLDVECRWSLAGERTDQERIGIQFLIQNKEATALDLRDLRLEYYYDADGHAATQSLAVYYYPIEGTAGQLLPMGAQTTTGADHRLALSFTACTTGCTLAANMSSSTLLANLAIVSGATTPRFDVSDDYSHVATDPGVAGTTESANPCEYIGVFLDDELIYGLPPNTVLP